MVIVPTQSFRESAIITGQGKSNIKRENEAGIRLKRIPCSFLRRKTIMVRDGGISSGKSLILSGLLLT